MGIINSSKPFYCSWKKSDLPNLFCSLSIQRSFDSLLVVKNPLFVLFYQFLALFLEIFFLLISTLS